jgi:hypothetical protein
MTQVVEASLRVCRLASFENPMNTFDSLDIYHSEKYDIKKTTRP